MKTLTVESEKGSIRAVVLWTVKCFDFIIFHHNIYIYIYVISLYKYMIIITLKVELEKANMASILVVALWK